MQEFAGIQTAGGLRHWSKPDIVCKSGETKAIESDSKQVLCLTFFFLGLFLNWIKFYWD